MNKTKKIAMTIFCTVFLSIFLSFSACGGEIENSGSSPGSSSQSESSSINTHKHAWNAEYSFNEDYHWLTCKTCNGIKTDYHEFPRHEFNECTVCQKSLGVTYELSTDGTYAIVVNYNNATNKVRIAETYQGVPVQAIAEDAFQDCYDITTVVLPKSITTIGNETFRWCRKLREVINHSPSLTVEKGAESNGYIAFYALSVFNTGDVYQDVFINDNGYIVYADGEKKTLVDYTGRATNLTLPDYITDIAHDAFEDKEFRLVLIPNSVKSIGDYAFKDCDNLTQIIIPESVVSIGNGAFRGCEKLESVHLGSGVRSIGKYAFNDCVSLTKINIPESVETIKDQTFMGCDSLTYIQIPDNVVSIGNGAFGSCKNLESIVLGSGVGQIELYAFSYCEKLQNIFYHGTQEELLKVQVDDRMNAPFLSASFYFFLENGQTSEIDGDYWCFDEENLPIILTRE